jgi:hypothetical protein
MTRPKNVLGAKPEWADDEQDQVLSCGGLTIVLHWWYPLRYGNGSRQLPFRRDRPRSPGLPRRPADGETDHGGLYEVHAFWPGTGPIDPAERAALTVFYTTGITAWTFDFLGLGSRRYHDEGRVIADDDSNSTDPCGGGGDVTRRLDGVYCIATHAVYLQARMADGAHLQSFPASMGRQ